MSKYKIYFLDKIKNLEHEIKKSKIPLHKKNEKKIVSTEDFDTAKPSKCKINSKYFLIVICLLYII